MHCIILASCDMNYRWTIRAQWETKQLPLTLGNDCFPLHEWFSPINSSSVISLVPRLFGCFQMYAFKLGTRVHSFGCLSQWSFNWFFLYTPFLICIILLWHNLSIVDLLHLIYGAFSIPCDLSRMLNLW